MTTTGLPTQLHRCGQFPQGPGLVHVCGRIATHRQTYRSTSKWVVETFRCEQHAIPADAPDHLTTHVQANGFSGGAA